MDVFALNINPVKPLFLLVPDGRLTHHGLPLKYAAEAFPGDGSNAHAASFADSKWFQ
jgi:hypothetical protein